MKPWQIKDAARQMAQIVTVSPDTTRQGAWRLMQEHHIHHLVVSKDGAVIGIVSDRDLWGKGDDLMSANQQPINGVMTPLLSTELVNEQTDLQQALMLMRTLRCTGLPVMHRQELVGIVTETDLLRLLERLLANSEAPARERELGHGKGYVLMSNPLVQNLMQLLSEAGI